MKKDVALHFARDWIAAWNAHDLDRILSHYDDAFEMNSPAITTVTGAPNGILYGKPAVREYWSIALNKYPDLAFKLCHVLYGVNSVTIIYEGVLGLSAEVFHFGPSGKVIKAFAHYDL